MDEAGFFEVFEGFFQTTCLGGFVCRAVVGNGCGTVQAFGEGECLFKSGDGFVHVEHSAFEGFAVRAEEYASACADCAATVGSEFEAFAVLSAFVAV